MWNNRNEFNHSEIESGEKPTYPHGKHISARQRIVDTLCGEICKKSPMGLCVDVKWLNCALTVIAFYHLVKLWLKWQPCHLSGERVKCIPSSEYVLPVFNSSFYVPPFMHLPFFIKPSNLKIPAFMLLFSLSLSLSLCLFLSVFLCLSVCLSVSLSLRMQIQTKDSQGPKVTLSWSRGMKDFS